MKKALSFREGFFYNGRLAFVVAHKSAIAADLTFIATSMDASCSRAPALWLLFHKGLS